MSLKVDRSSYGSISIVRCAGIIGVGDSLGKLEEALLSALNDSDRLVLELKGVDRIDSTGMGLLVRFLSRARKQGGDLRLCSPSQFVRKLLSVTKLDSVFLIYTSEYNAIASFFVRSAPGDERHDFTATVLFLEQSEDLCAFARTVLGQHGYEVLTTGRLADAELLAQAAQPAIIVFGPRAIDPNNEEVLRVLQAVAPNASTVTLPADFAESYANRGAAALLNAVKVRRSEGVSGA